MIATEDLARGLIVAGISGLRADPDLPSFGGYLLFASEGAPLSDVRALTDALRARSAHKPPLIAIDQEGGSTARRLREGVEPMPPMMALGAAADVELARRAGEQTAFDLRRAGCTLDFAPVLDLAVDPGNTAIGARSFGADPRQVAELGGALGRGLCAGGILPCYKHFPGHGATAVDSHHALPVVDADEATLRARDLVPFAAVAPSAPAMMTAHVVALAFDSQQPATLSRRIATTLLRDELGFRGALFTDCLEMNAVAPRGAGENAVAALGAGADLLIFSHDIDAAIVALRAICAAVGDGRLARERLEEAHARVMRLREAGSPPLPLDAAPPHPGIGREIARRAVTLLRGVAHADPIASIVVSFGASSAALDREAPAMETLDLPIGPAENDVDGALEALARSQRRPILLARRAHLNPRQAAAIRVILDRYPDALVVSLLEPFDVGLFGSARHLVAAYGDDPASIGGLADVIFGGSLATGRLPIDVS
jgi:beta-N-acetylhexosaminidase